MTNSTVVNSPNVRLMKEGLLDNEEETKSKNTTSVTISNEKRVGHQSATDPLVSSFATLFSPWQGFAMPGMRLALHPAAVIIGSFYLRSEHSHGYKYGQMH